MAWTFLDVDRHIENSAGATARELFTALGETAFRKLESDTLAFALEQSSTIIALGGAAIDAPANQLLLAQSAHTLVVFLDAPFPTLIERCLMQERNGPAPYRPLLHKAGTAHTRFLTRRALYAKHASLTVDVAERAAEEVERLIQYAAGSPNQSSAKP